MKKPMNSMKLVKATVRLNRRGQAVLVDPVNGETVIIADAVSGRNVKLVEDVRKVLLKFAERVLGTDPANSAYEAELVQRVKLAGLEPCREAKDNLNMLRSMGLPVPRASDFRKKRHMSDKERGRFGRTLKSIAQGAMFPCGHPRALNTVFSAAGRPRCAACNSAILQNE